MKEIKMYLLIGIAAAIFQMACWNQAATCTLWALAILFALRVLITLLAIVIVIYEAINGKS